MMPHAVRWLAVALFADKLRDSHGHTPRNASTLEALFRHDGAPDCDVDSYGGHGKRDGLQPRSGIVTPVELERWPCASFASDCLVQLAFRTWPVRASTEALCTKLTAPPLLDRLAAAGTPPHVDKAATFSAGAGGAFLPPMGAEHLPIRSRWRQCAVTSGLTAPGSVAQARMRKLIDEVDGPIIRPNALCVQVRATAQTTSAVRALASSPLRRLYTHFVRFRRRPHRPERSTSSQRRAGNCRVLRGGARP
jgi:hypothetical protein